MFIYQWKKEVGKVYVIRLPIVVFYNEKKKHCEFLSSAGFTATYVGRNLNKEEQIKDEKFQSSWSDFVCCKMARYGEQEPTFHSDKLIVHCCRRGPHCFTMVCWLRERERESFKKSNSNLIISGPLGTIPLMHSRCTSVLIMHCTHFILKKNQKYKTHSLWKQLE